MIKGLWLWGDFKEWGEGGFNNNTQYFVILILWRPLYGFNEYVYTLLQATKYFLVEATLKTEITVRPHNSWTERDGTLSQSSSFLNSLTKNWKKKKK